MCRPRRDGAGKTTITECGLAHEWFQGSIANAASIAAEVDRFYVYDNSVDDRDAQLVLRATNGQVARQYVEARLFDSPPYPDQSIRGADPVIAS